MLTQEPIHHPWFTSTLKRKRSTQSPSPLPSDAGLTHDEQLRRKKQRGLEAGLASLSLVPDNHAYSLQPHQIPPHMDPTLSRSPLGVPSPEDMGIEIGMDDAMGDNDSVEAESEDSDIKMKTVRWYEPEKDRIVVVDLDSDSDTDSEPDRHSKSRSQRLPPSEAQYTVSPAVLSRLPPIPSSTIPLPSTGANDSKALVLFKPVPWAPPSASSPEEKYAVKRPSHAVNPNTSIDEDVVMMEVE